MARDNSGLPMPSLVFCYAPEDETAARELARFLEANLAYQVSLEECRVRPDFDLVDAAERALSADAALILLSPAAVPKTWKRERWEPVFSGDAQEFGTSFGFVLLRECKFPELFRRRQFFDLSQSFLQGSRDVKHWLMRPEGVTSRTDAFPELRAALADWPGISFDLASETACDFAAACAGDFEAVYRVACRGRSAAGILGDIGYAVGLRLLGNAAQNRSTLVTACATRRWLFIFEGLSAEHRDLLHFGGKTSVIVTVDETSHRLPVEDIGAAFLVSTRDDVQCGPLVGPATLLMYELLQADFAAGLRLGWAVLAVVKSAGRFAESVEILAAMEAAARARNDDMALYKIEWEQSWTVDDSDAWSVRILPTASEEVAQLSLFE